MKKQNNSIQKYKEYITVFGDKTSDKVLDGVNGWNFNESESDEFR